MTDHIDGLAKLGQWSHESWQLTTLLESKQRVELKRAVSCCWNAVLRPRESDNNFENNFSYPIALSPLIYTST